MEKILDLEPACLRLTVPASYEDRNGHMNMRWYLALFDDAGEPLSLRLGLTPEYHQIHATGTFDLEHHLHFLREVLPGQQIAIYARLLGHSAKRLHYLMVMVNETRGTLAALFECLTSFADLAARKTAPFPPEIASRIAAGVAAHARLDWPPPVCGTMRA